MNDAELEALEAQYKKAVYPSHVAGANNIVFDSNLIEKGVRKLLDEVKAARLQVSEQKNKYSDLLQSHASLCGKIEELKDFILRDSPECPGDDPCSCVRCRFSIKPVKGA